MNREALLGTKYNQMTREKKLNEASKVGKHKKGRPHPAMETKPGFRILITLMWIRIPIFTLMRIWIMLLIEAMRICDN